MKNIRVTYIGLLLVGILLIQSCSEKPTGLDDEQELITDVVVRFRDTTNAANDTLMRYHDPDGDVGPASPVITGARLRSAATYLCTVELYDMSKMPPDTITYEINEEAVRHRFDHYVSGFAGSDVTITVTDTDVNGLPIGLEFQTTVKSGVSGSGTFRVLLNHFHNVTKGLSNVDETDIDISFPLLIE